MENKLLKSIVYLCLFAVFSLHANEQCVSDWNNLQVNENSLETTEALIELWQSKESLCSDGDFYYLKLGTLFVENRDLDKAEKSFKQGLAIRGQYIQDIELGLADLVFQSVVGENGTVDMDGVLKAEKVMHDYIAKYPDASGGYAHLTGIYLVLEDFDKVIDSGSKALELGEETFARRNLAIAYYQKAEFQKSIDMASLVVERYSHFLSDKDLMLATALSYGEIGRYDVSLGALKILVSNDPDVKSDDEFQRVVNYLQESYIAEQ